MSLAQSRNFRYGGIKLEPPWWFNDYGLNFFIVQKDIFMGTLRLKPKDNGLSEQRYEDLLEALKEALKLMKKIAFFMI